MVFLQVAWSVTAGCAFHHDWLCGEEMKSSNADGATKVVDMTYYAEHTTVYLNGLKNTHWGKQSVILEVI